MKQSNLKRVKIALALGACAVPMMASAGEGLYLGLEGGANFGLPQKYNIYGYNGLFNVPDGTYVSTTTLKTGWIGGLVGGYSFANGLRPELEIDYRRNDYKHQQLRNGTDASNVGGFVNTDTAMGNIWFDFFKSSWIHPYIGGGIGAARIAIRHPTFNNNNLRSWFDTAFAYQGGAGVNVDLSRHISLSLDYRYIQTEKGEFNLLNDQPNTMIKTNYRAHSAMLGLKYSFGGEDAPPVAPPEPPVAVVPAEEPAPIPEPVAPPCQSPTPGQPVTLEGCKAGDILVLRGVNFDFNKASLTVNAKTLLDGVAEALTTRADIKVEIDGHTDSKGSDAYNQKLSQRRADSVKKYLLQRGIAGDRMTTRGFGETKPIADNDSDEGREMNRRVELQVTESGEVVPVAQ